MLEQNSQASYLALDPQKQAEFLESLSDEESLALLYEWGFWARPNQIEPTGDWLVWLLLAGRGFGKTRTGAETIRDWAENGTAKRMALIGPTAGDVRDVMIEGESGLLAISAPWCRPSYEPSKRRLTWPNGAFATAYSADEPERLRGPQHDAFWADELASWRYPEAWDQLQFGLRLGARPRGIVTTTPKPIALVRDLLKDPTTAVTRGSTYDNRANLAASFFTKIVSKYEGTRLGRQELKAEILDDVPGALWTRALLAQAQARPGYEPPDFARVVVAVDPSGTKGDGQGDDIGLVIAARGVDGRAYVIKDRTASLSPAGWGRRTVESYDEFSADRVVAESNFGGAMVEATIITAAKDMDHPFLPYTPVRASRGKSVRAEPIAALYEQGRVTHLDGMPQLEDELCNFTSAGYVGGGSPNRADALVWALTELMLDKAAPREPKVW